MRITFLGAARMVTGSSYLVEVGQCRILVDCGMFQGSKSISALNNRQFPYDPSSLNCVLLTHAHIDHSGLLPKLCKQGFKGPIYSTRVTNELCKIMLPDSAHIQEFDAEIANRKGKRAGRPEVKPLYTVDDAYRTLEHFVSVEYEQELTISPELRVKFKDAGHILGSSMVELTVSENGKTTKVVFSGDLGQPNQPLIEDPSVVNEADFVVIESTYGNRRHEAYDKQEKLAQIINDTVNRGGNIIIPSFAVGRTQAILYYLHKLFMAGEIPDIPVIIDSPLAISATDIFMKNTEYYDEEAKQLLVTENDSPLNLPHLKFTRTAEESKALNDMDTPAIIISASGMADAGRILHHLKHNLWKPEASVLFVGYQAQGSLGRRLLEGVKRVKILGEEISVKAQIHRLEGFSAHADQEQLLEWLTNFKNKPANVFVVHGEYDMAEPFARIIEEKLGISACIPRYGDVAVIDGRAYHLEESSVSAVGDPEVKRLYEYLSDIEEEYKAYRKRIESLVVSEPRRASEIIARLDKVYSYMKKTFNGH